jgi:hypothetical protein
MSAKHPVWTWHDLLKQLAMVMPPETRCMDALAARELLLSLAEEALSGRTGEVVCLEAPQWPPLPAPLRRELDGRSVYTRPGTARYATTAQLSLEDALLARAQTLGAPRLPGDMAARHLGTDLALIEAQLRGTARDAREQFAQNGLRLDQAAAVWHVLTSARTVEVITGPAGTGNCAARVHRSAVMDWRREENSRIISPEMPLISNPCPSSRASQATPNRRVSASSRCWDTIAATAPMCSL